VWLLVFVFRHNRRPDNCIVPFIIPVIIFPSRNWCDTTDSYLRFISTSVRRLYLFFPVLIFSGGSKNIAGQTTVPFFPVIIYFVHSQLPDDCIIFFLVIIFWSRIRQTDDCIFFAPARQTTRTFFFLVILTIAHPPDRRLELFFSGRNNDRASARQTTVFFFRS
jgi:hypothetical protein